MTTRYGLLLCLLLLNMRQCIHTRQATTCPSFKVLGDIGFELIKDRGGLKLHEGDLEKLNQAKEWFASQRKARKSELAVTAKLGEQVLSKLVEALPFLEAIELQNQTAAALIHRSTTGVSPEQLIPSARKHFSTICSCCGALRALILAQEKSVQALAGLNGTFMTLKLAAVEEEVGRGTPSKRSFKELLSVMKERVRLGAKKSVNTSGDLASIEEQVKQHEAAFQESPKKMRKELLALMGPLYQLGVVLEDAEA